MILTIICPKVTKQLREIVNKICSLTGVSISEYDLIDPASNNIEKYFPAALVLGDTKFDQKNCEYFIRLPLPSVEMDLSQKILIVNGFEAASQFLKGNTDPKTFKANDMPSMLDLEEYLKKRCGSLVVIKLEDNRMMGVYPDGSKFDNKYDIEIHYSTLINVEKIFRMFKAKEVLIKE